MKAHLSAALVSCTLLACGCYRYQTQVPGVVDLRSDASETRRERPTPPDDEDLARSSGMNLVLGDGVRVERERVVVEDRHVFLRGLVPVWNTSAKEELDAALALSGGLGDVEIHEEYGPLDIGITLLAAYLPIAGFAAPSTYTFRASGDALSLEAATSERGEAVPPPFDDLAPPPMLEDLP